VVLCQVFEEAFCYASGGSAAVQVGCSNGKGGEYVNVAVSWSLFSSGSVELHLSLAVLAGHRAEAVPGCGAAERVTGSCKTLPYIICAKLPLPSARPEIYVKPFVHQLPSGALLPFIPPHTLIRRPFLPFYPAHCIDVPSPKERH
jgi:hypothetical protein